MTERRCEVCGQLAGAECVNTITPGVPLPGRFEHEGRRERPTPQPRQEKK